MLVFDISENDVLLGRGALTVNNEGNKRFRTIVEPWKAEYRGGNRKRKNEIAQIVVEQVFEHNGRFLERVDGEKLQNYGLPVQTRAWKEADMNIAMEKAKQALRSKDTFPGLLKEDDVDHNNHEMQQPEVPTGSDLDDVITLSKDALDTRLPAFSIHSQQLRQEDVAGHVTELMQQSTPRVQEPPGLLHHQQQSMFNPLLGSIHVNEQEQIDHLLHSEGGRRFRTVAATRPSPSPHDAILLNELAHLQQKKQSMAGSFVNSATTISVATQLENDDKEEDDY